VVRLGALGPILAPYRPLLNAKRAEFLADITREWGPRRAELFAHHMFSTMPDDEAREVLRLLGEGQHLHETIDVMPQVATLLTGRGIDRSVYKDRGWVAGDVARGIGHTVESILNTSEASKFGRGQRAMRMASELPAPYREGVSKSDTEAVMAALTPGNLLFGAFDTGTLGLLSAAKGVVYDVPRSVVSGVGAIAAGHVASGVEQLTGAAIVVVGSVVGVRAFRKSQRLAGMLELTPEGGALYENLSRSIGSRGLDRVAKWVAGSSEAQILVREEGAAGITALHRANGDLAVAREALAKARTTREGAAAVPASAPTRPPSPPTVEIGKGSFTAAELEAISLDEFRPRTGDPPLDEVRPAQRRDARANTPSRSRKRVQWSPSRIPIPSTSTT
jgi:hypothetical protein